MKVAMNDNVACIIFYQPTLFQIESPSTNLPYGCHIMTHEKYRTSFMRRHNFHLSETLLLKLGVTYRQYLVYNQDVRLQVRRDGKRKANVHTARVVLYRSIEKFIYLGKSNDFIEFLLDLVLRHPKNSAV